MSQSDEVHPNPLIALFRQCVVCITDEAGQFRGSGFFVAPGQVVTCGHVVHGMNGPRLLWQDRTTTAVEVAAAPPLESVANPGDYPLPDLAVLSADEATGWGHPCAALAEGQPVPGIRDGLYLAGYTIEHGPVPVLTGTTTEFESEVIEAGHGIFKLKRGLVLPGLSGSPLLDLGSGLVSGITESTRGRQADLGGFAVSVSELEAFPGLVEASRAFHDGDDRWRSAFEAEKVRAAQRAGERGRLPLRPPVVALALDEDLSPATVLRPRHAVVGFVGREELLTDLAAWCEREHDGGSPVKLWLVTGGGGFGKTRLAVEVCREAEARGWTTGLLRPDAGNEGLRALAEWPGRLLIAVDYAESSPGLVGRLIEELAAREARPAVRVILLIRRRASRAELLELLNQQHEEEFDRLLRQAFVSRLEDNESDVDRLELYRRATADLAPFLGATRAVGARRTPHLRAGHFARPLYVLAAACLAAMPGGTDVDALDEAELLRTLLDQHEASHWARVDKHCHLGLNPADQRAAVAIATLLGAEGNEEALTVVRLVPHIGAEPESRLIAIARWLARLYPPPREGERVAIGPLEPDRLGEVLVGDVLHEHRNLLAMAIDSASDRQLTRALIVTARIARDDATVSAQLREALDDRLPDILQRGFRADDEGDLLSAVATAMTISRPARGAVAAAVRLPHIGPSWYTPLAASVTALAVDGLRSQAIDDPDSAKYLPGLLNNLAVRLGDLGRPEEALQASTEAVAQFRQLAQTSSDINLPPLAKSLDSMAVHLSNLGQEQQALDAAAEAVMIHRQLASANPDAYRLDLAKSLSNLSASLSRLGRLEEALEAASETAASFRQLAQADPDTHLPDLAESLGALALCLAGVGRLQEGLELDGEAISILRQLATSAPDAYLADLAWSLSSFAAACNDSGRRQEALEPASESVAYFRQLAQANPRAYLHGLAASLHTFAAALSELGRRQEALEPASESVAYYRQLAQANPGAYRPKLAWSLNTLANNLNEAGASLDALAAINEAITIRRPLAQSNPDAHLDDLAASLTNFATFLTKAGRPQEAIEPAEEAATYFRQLAQINSEKYMPELAWTISNLAAALGELERWEAALKPASEAVTIRRLLTRANPDAHLNDLATSLSNLAAFLTKAGRPQEAIEPAEEATRYLRQLAQANPDIYLPKLDAGLRNLAMHLSDAGKDDQAEDLFADVLRQFSSSTKGTGHVVLARGYWRARQEKIAEAIFDLLAAITAFDRESDYLARGEARQTLIKLRRINATAFDVQWDHLNESKPIWLQHIDDTQQLADEIITWAQTADLDESRAYLEDKSSSMLTDEAEALMEHLIDQNPTIGKLHELLQLLQQARVRGISAVYADYQEQVSKNYLLQVLMQWLATPSWAASRSFAATYGNDLLDSLSILDTFGLENPSDLGLRVHCGLLGYAAVTGFDAAYDLLSDASRLQAILADPTTPIGPRFSVAQIYSGLAADDPEGHFQYAVIALRAIFLLPLSPEDVPRAATGMVRQAAAALADCAANAAPYEQRDFALRLDQLAAEDPPLAPYIAEVRHILTGTSSDDPPR